LDKDKDFIVRLFNVYGLRGEGFVNIACNKIQNNEKLIINGSGSQTRDFVNVADVVSALKLGMKKTGIYNIGTGIETKILDIVKIAERVSGKKSEMQFKTGVKEIQRSCADISKIRRLNWEPRVGLEQGIRKILGEKNKIYGLNPKKTKCI